MARRVTRDRVPERKEIILWTHADKTRHAPPGIIPPGTEFAQMRPKKLRPNFSGKQGAPTTQDLQNIDQFLASLEQRTNELLQPREPSPIKKKTQRRTKRGLLVEKPFLKVESSKIQHLRRFTAEWEGDVEADFDSDSD